MALGSIFMREFFIFEDLVSRIAHYRGVSFARRHRPGGTSGVALLVLSVFESPAADTDYPPKPPPALTKVSFGGQVGRVGLQAAPDGTSAPEETRDGRKHEGSFCPEGAAPG